MLPTYLTARPFKTLEPKLELVQSDLGLLHHPWLVIPNDTEPTLYLESYDYGFTWVTKIGDPLAYATCSFKLPGLGNSDSSSLHHFDWLQLQNRFFQFVENTSDVYPKCAPVALGSGSTPVQVCTAVCASINANLDMLATFDGVDVITVTMTTHGDTNIAMTASTANNLDLQRMGFAGEALDVASAPVLTGLEFSGTDLMTGFTAEHLQALQGPLVFAEPPTGYVKSIIGEDPGAVKYTMFTLTHGVTWTLISGLEALWLAPHVPGNPLLGNGGCSESDIAGVPARESESCHCCEGGENFKGVSFNDTTAGKWLGPVGDTLGNTGSSDVGMIPGLNQ